MSLQNRTIIITGGTKGVGRAIAEHLAGLGYTLALTYSSDEEAAAATQQAVAATGAACLLFRADTRSRGSTEALFAEVGERFGAPYGVIANAGVENVEAPVSEMTEDELDRVVDINVKGTFLTLQAAARHVVDGGRIIATGSTIALYPPRGAAVYAATKAATRLMIEVLAQEVGARRVTANSLNPGPVAGAGIFTNITDSVRDTFAAATPLGRVPAPRDIAPAAAFLLSDGAAMVSGHHMEVTGGFRI